jgi:hypothetical protein
MSFWVDKIIDSSKVLIEAGFPLEMETRGIVREKGFMRNQGEIEARMGDSLRTKQMRRGYIMLEPFGA